MPPANKKWQQDDGEVMLRVAEGLKVRPKVGGDLFGSCAHDHLPFTLIRSQALSDVGILGEGSATDTMPPLPALP